MTAQHIKKLSAPYTILSANSASPTLVTIGNMTNDNSQLVVYGNLIVTGAHTNINTLNTSVTDNVLTLNAGESGIGVTLNTAGLIVDRGKSANVSLLWNESDKAWELTPDGTTYYDVAYVQKGLHALTKVEDDTNPFLGGNLNVNGFNIYSSSTTNIILNAAAYTEVTTSLQLDYSNAPISSSVNSVTINANLPGQGQSGIYVTNSVGSDEELITVNRAIVYSIIF